MTLALACIAHLEHISVLCFALSLRLLVKAFVRCADKRGLYSWRIIIFGDDLVDMCDRVSAKHTVARAPSYLSRDIRRDFLRNISTNKNKTKQTNKQIVGKKILFMINRFTLCFFLLFRCFTVNFFMAGFFLFHSSGKRRTYLKSRKNSDFSRRGSCTKIAEASKSLARVIM